MGSVESKMIDQSGDETLSVLPQTTAFYGGGIRKRREDETPGTISPHEELWIVHNQDDHSAFRFSDHAKRVIQDVKNICEISSSTFTPLSIAQLDPSMNWTNLKRLYIQRIETNQLLQLLQDASNLEELEIYWLQISSKENRFFRQKTEIKLANLRAFHAEILTGQGKLKFLTPKLTYFGSIDSEAIELAFPETLRDLSSMVYERSMRRFKNVESLACDAHLPDDLLTTFTKLKRLDYPSSVGEINLCSPGNFLSYKKTILSILREKKRLKRTELVIVFYGVLLEDEQQIEPESHSDFTEFLMKNYSQLCEDRLMTINRIDYTSLINYLALSRAELPEDFHSKFRFIEEVKVRDAVDDPEQLLQFLAAFENPFSLDLTDASLDSTFYRQLARVARVEGLTICYVDEKVDLSQMEQFRFLLEFKHLKRFVTTIELSSELIKSLLTKFTGDFSIFCQFNKIFDTSIYVGRDDDRLFLLKENSEKKEMDSLQALIDELDVLRIEDLLEIRDLIRDL